LEGIYSGFDLEVWGKERSSAFEKYSGFDLEVWGKERSSAFEKLAKIKQKKECGRLYSGI